MSLLTLVYSQLFVEPPTPDYNFTGQTIIVTGGNAGLGFEAARHLVRLKASRIVLGARSLDKGTMAAELLKSSAEYDSSHCKIEVLEIDLENYTSVQKFAESVAGLDRVDAVLLNAGKITQEFYLAEGNESTLTVNVTATFLLLILLLPILRRSASRWSMHPRVSVVSSDRHAEVKLPEWKEDGTFAALNDSSKADMNKRYHVSKLLQILLVRNLAQQLQHHRTAENSGHPVIINTLTPGLCISGLTKYLHGSFGAKIAIMTLLLARTTEVGARTLVAALAQGIESHGKYMFDGKIQESTLSSFVRSEEGTLAGQKVWEELMHQLEAVQPNIRQVMYQSL